MAAIFNAFLLNKFRVRLSKLNGSVAALKDIVLNRKPLHPILGGRAVAAAVTTLASVLVALPSAHAADKIQFSERSTAVDIPRPSTSLEGVGRRFDSFTSGDSPAGAINIPNTPPPSNSSAPNRKLQEMIDREKNWIFLNPKDSGSKDNSLTGLSGKGGAWDESERHNDPSSQNKSVMERFFTEKDSRANNEKPALDFTRPEDRKAPSYGDTRDREQGGLTSSFIKPEQGAMQELATFHQFLESDAFRRADDIEARGPAGRDTRLITPVISPAESQMTKAHREQLEQRQEMRASDFRKLLGGDTRNPNVIGGIEGLNTQVDTTRIDVNPIAPTRPAGVGANSFNSPGARPSPLSSSFNFNPRPSAGLAEITTPAVTLPAISRPDIAPAASSSRGSVLTMENRLLIQRPQRKF